MCWLWTHCHPAPHQGGPHVSGQTKAHAQWVFYLGQLRMRDSVCVRERERERESEREREREGELDQGAGGMAGRETAMASRAWKTHEKVDQRLQ